MASENRRRLRWGLILAVIGVDLVLLAWMYLSATMGWAGTAIAIVGILLVVAARGERGIK